MIKNKNGAAFLILLGVLSNKEKVCWQWKHSRYQLRRRANF